MVCRSASHDWPGKGQDEKKALAISWCLFERLFLICLERNDMMFWVGFVPWGVFPCRSTGNTSKIHLQLNSIIYIQFQHIHQRVFDGGGGLFEYRAYCHVC